MEIEDEGINRYIWTWNGYGMDMEWIWNGNVNAMIYDKYKVDITFVHRMEM